MISASSLAVEGLGGRGGHAGHAGHAYPPTPAGMSSEFLRPLPRPAPYARYPRAPPPAAPPPAPAPDDALYASYARFLPHPLPFAPYAAYAPPAPPAPYRQLQLRSGFVPPAPRPPVPRSPPPPPAAPCSPPAPRGFKAPAAAPSGKEGSLKHRLLSRRREEHFARGALIRLDGGELRRVEDMRTEDFVQSADADPDLRLADSTVVRLDERPASGSVSLTLAYNSNRSRVDVERPSEHPFFVYGRGWASFSPERTLQCYGLRVNRLRVGDVCVSLTPRDRSGDRPGDRPGDRLGEPAASLAAAAATVVTTATATAVCARPSGQTQMPTQTPTQTQTQPENLSTRPRAEGRAESEEREARRRRWSAPDDVKR